jgi:hypothetical protein
MGDNGKPAERPTLDETIVEDLALEYMRVARKHYLARGVVDPNVVLENLNALALVIAMIFEGCDFSEHVTKFFSDALAMQCVVERARKNRKTIDEIWPDE